MKTCDLRLVPFAFKNIARDYPFLKRNRKWDEACNYFIPQSLCSWGRTLTSLSLEAAIP